MGKINFVFGFCFNEKETFVDLNGKEITGWDLLHFQMPRYLEMYPNSHLRLMDFGTHQLDHSHGKCVVLEFIKTSDNFHLDIPSYEYSKLNPYLNQYYSMLENLNLDHRKYKPTYQVIVNI